MDSRYVDNVDIQTGWSGTSFLAFKIVPPVSRYLVSSVSEGLGQGGSVVAEFACANIVSSPAETVQTCRDKAQSLVSVLASMPGKVIVYGGRGGLGVVVVSTFRQAGYEVLSVDIVANTEAEHNVLVSLDTTWPGQEEQVCRGVEAALAVSQAGNIFCGA